MSTHLFVAVALVGFPAAAAQEKQPKPIPPNIILIWPGRPRARRRRRTSTAWRRRACASSVTTRPGTGIELYDLAADPHEARNLVALNPK